MSFRIMFRARCIGLVKFFNVSSRRGRHVRGGRSGGNVLNPLPVLILIADLVSVQTCHLYARCWRIVCRNAPYMRVGIGDAQSLADSEIPR